MEFYDIKEIDIQFKKLSLKRKNNLDDINENNLYNCKKIKNDIKSILIKRKNDDDLDLNKLYNCKKKKINETIDKIEIDDNKIEIDDNKIEIDDNKIEIDDNVKIYKRLPPNDMIYRYIN
jgi:hypothetical protein